MAGRPPKPTHLKLVDGNPGKRPINKDEPKVEPGRPPMPRWLPKDGKDEWKLITAALESMGVLTKVDASAIAAYCAAWADLRAAQRGINKSGVFYKTRTGLIKRNPAAGVKADALRVVKAYLVEFGLTPASRSKVKVKPANQDSDPFSDIFS